jgi:hypothetical protein
MRIRFRIPTPVRRPFASGNAFVVTLAYRNDRARRKRAIALHAQPFYSKELRASADLSGDMNV